MMSFALFSDHHLSAMVVGGGSNWGVLEASVPVGVTLSLQNHPALVEKRCLAE